MFFSHSPFFSDIQCRFEKSRVEPAEVANFGLNVPECNAAVWRSWRRATVALAGLLGNLRDAECDGVDGGMSVKLEALEADLFVSLWPTISGWGLWVMLEMRATSYSENRPTCRWMMSEQNEQQQKKKGYWRSR